MSGRDLALGFYAQGGRGGGRGGSHQAGGGPPQKKERVPILDLSKYVDKSIRVKFAGGRQVQGQLKGYDQLFNLVLDQVHELDADTDAVQRSLGLVVLRGTALVLIAPEDGYEEIQNPFAQA